MATYILKSFFAIVIILICWFQLKKEKSETGKLILQILLVVGMFMLGYTLIDILMSL